MDFKNSLILGSKKFAKGMFALFCMKILLIGTVAIIQACSADESDFDKGKIDGLKFKNALNLSVNGIEKIIANADKEKYAQERLTVNNGIKCYTGLNNYGNTVELCYSTSQENEFEQELQPALTEAKNYLYSKGFTNNEISQMIASENGHELDLIPLVMTMVELEGNSIASTNLNLSSFFGYSAFAQSAPELTSGEIGWCALAAIGADILIQLGNSSASSWSKSAIKKAFGAVAKRALGPIGVAIAVVSFGICIGQQAQD